MVTRDFSEFLGRLGFVSQLLVWLKRHLSPLYACASATSSSTVAKLPDAVILTLTYLLAEFRTETYMVAGRWLQDVGFNSRCQSLTHLICVHLAKGPNGHRRRQSYWRHLQHWWRLDGPKRLRLVQTTKRTSTSLKRGLLPSGHLC